VDRSAQKKKALGKKNQYSHESPSNGRMVLNTNLGINYEEGGSQYGSEDLDEEGDFLMHEEGSGLNEMSN